MSARYVYAVVGILALAAGYACWCRTPLIWDGAYQFNATLIMQRPYFYLTRFHTYFLWWPTVWASRVTSNVSILQTVYGLPFLIAPVLAVLLSWWMVHQHAPYLIIWAIFGVCAGALPGQIFIINDSLLQMHFFWPVFMGMFVPLSVPKKIVISILILFQFVHPVGMLLFAGAAFAAAVLGFVKSQRPVKDVGLFIACTALFAIAVNAILRIFVYRTELTIQLLFATAVLGLLAIIPAIGWHKLARIPAAVILIAVTVACFFVPISPNSRTVALMCIFAIAWLMTLATTADHPRMFVRAAVMVGLFLFALSKIYITNHIPSLFDGYAAEEAKWSTAIDRWSVGVRGWPLHGLWFMWSSAGMLFLWARWRGRLTEKAKGNLSILLGLALSLMVWEYRHRLIDASFSAIACLAFYFFLLQFRNPAGPRAGAGILPLLCAAAGAICWIHWAGDGRLWWKAIDYRRWVGPLTAPFFLCAILDALAVARLREAVAQSDAQPPRPLREPLAMLLVVTFAMVIFLQSTGWHNMSAQLMQTVRHYPAIIVPEAAVPWMSETPLDHWATADYVMAMQGKVPTKLLLSPIGEEHIYETPPKIPHWDFYPGARANHPDPTPGPVGWFDLRPLLERLSREPRPKQFDGPKRLDAKTTPE